MKQTLTEQEGKIDGSTVEVVDFNSPLLIVDRTTREKINKEREDYRPIRPNKYIQNTPPNRSKTRFSQVHLGHSLGYVEHSLGYVICYVIKKTLLIWNNTIFSDHNEMKLEINSRRKTGKSTNMWNLTHSWETSGSKLNHMGN